MSVIIRLLHKYEKKVKVNANKCPGVGRKKERSKIIVEQMATFEDY